MSFDPNVRLSEQGKNLIVAVNLEIAGTTVLCNDMPDNFTSVRGNSFGMTLSYDTLEEASGVFERLRDGGQVFVPLSALPGQGYYGMLGDRFDLTWTITAPAV